MNIPRESPSKHGKKALPTSSNQVQDGPSTPPLQAALSEISAAQESMESQWTLALWLWRVSPLGATQWHGSLLATCIGVDTCTRDTQRFTEVTISAILVS